MSRKKLVVLTAILLAAAWLIRSPTEEGDPMSFVVKSPLRNLPTSASPAARASEEKLCVRVVATDGSPLAGLNLQTLAGVVVSRSTAEGLGCVDAEGASPLSVAGLPAFPASVLPAEKPYPVMVVAEACTLELQVDWGEWPGGELRLWGAGQLVWSTPAGPGAGSSFEQIHVPCTNLAVDLWPPGPPAWRVEPTVVNARSGQVAAA